MKRNYKLNFAKSMQQYSIRTSYRRKLNISFRNKGKDKIWHRAVKRSIKNFERNALIIILQDNQQPSLLK